ncbi:hypothetical protein JY651_23210 [Pyxidicoccus parkwayensis]|uniref:Uncharacterized protein n=1 Tax=Pyxidicoccus parkwayensis TaxID=2813578 RepID=A0ABX7PAU0_9BACT|nr:hypothetical protein [Pyxidicoccus parkwaysis]QSQ27639.1 hypothetical protein JY651_23210 [Pyxidicoccus parkwaysis]
MNKLLGIASLVLASTALAVSLMGRGEPAAPAPAHQEAPASATAADMEELEQRIRALEDTSLGLSRRLMALEARPAVSADGGVVAAPAGLSAEIEQLRAEVRGMVAGEALNSEGGRAYLKDAVRSVQDEMRNEQREARQQEWAQMQAQAQTQRAERLRKFVTEAGLNYNQEQTLTRRMQAEETKRQALMAEVQAGTKNPRDIRQELRAERQQTDQEMSSLLNEEQQAKYRELRQEEWGNGRQRGGFRAGGEQQP